MSAEWLIEKHLLRYHHAFFRLSNTASWLMPIAEKMRMSRIILDHEQIWAHFLGSRHVIKSLGELSQMGLMSEAETEQAINKYRSWHEIATKQLYQVSEQYPEFVTLMQNRLGQRMILLAELETAEKQAEDGAAGGRAGAWKKTCRT